MATSTLLLYLAFSLCVHFSRAGRYFEQNNDDTCICKLNCPIEEVLQEVEQLEERVKNLDRSQTEQRLSLEKKLDSLQKRPEETHTSATSQTNAVNQNNAVVRVEEQMAALHRNITTGQQQMTEMQQQMMAELQTQRRMMLALETRSKPKDCAEIQQDGHTQNGVYVVFIGSNLRPVRVFCDLEHEGGGWLVFQRRKDGSQNFQQNWDVYARGFGNLLGEFWLGNDFLHMLTEQKTYTLRVDMEDFDNDQRYAEYSTIAVGPASEKFRLRLGDYSGDAGDSMAYHSGEQFSTIDQDNDWSSSHCSSESGGGGWWYAACCYANLNGLYLRGGGTAYRKGVLWRHWRGFYYSLKTTLMKIRPANY